MNIEFIPELTVKMAPSRGEMHSAGINSTGQVAEWEKQLAALIARNATGPESASHILDPPSPLVTGMPLSYQCAANTSYINVIQPGAAVRPVPEAVEDEMTQRIQAKVINTVRVMLNNKLSPTERSIDIVRGQLSSLSSDINRQQGTSETAGSTVSRFLKTMKREYDSLQSRVTAMASDVVMLQRRQGSYAMAQMQKEVTALRADIHHLRQENASMRQELDAIGIGGGGDRYRDLSINDRIKSIVAHAVIIQSSEVEQGLVKSLDALQSCVHCVHVQNEQKRADACNANDSMKAIISNAMAVIKKDLEDQFHGAINCGLQEARSNLQQSMTQRLESVLKGDEAARHKELSALQADLLQINTNLQEKCIGEGEVRQLVAEAEKRAVAASIRASTGLCVEVQEQDALDTDDRLKQYNQNLQGLLMSLANESSERKADVSKISEKLHITQSLCETQVAGLEMIKSLVGAERLDALEQAQAVEPVSSPQQQPFQSPLVLDPDLLLRYVANDVSADATAATAAFPTMDDDEDSGSIPTLESSDGADIGLSSTEVAMEREPEWLYSSVVAELQKKIQRSQ